jgi:D-alanine-D-alanine ligase
MTLAVALDKAMAKRVFAYEGIATAPFRVIRERDEVDVQGLRYPLFVKPLREGSSMGINERSRAECYEEVRALVLDVHYNYRQPALVEEFLSGREFTVGILGTHDVEFFPIMEINYEAVPDGSQIYSQRFKSEWYSWQYYNCPAPLSDLEQRRIHETAFAAYQALGCRDFGRVDVRYDRDGQPCILEVNPICGLAPDYGDYPKLAEAAGYSYSALINAILDRAVERWTQQDRIIKTKTGD